MGLFVVGLTAILALVAQNCNSSNTGKSTVVNPLFWNDNHMQTKSSSQILNHKKRQAAARTLRGRKHFDPEEDGFFDDFGFKKGQYFAEKEQSDFTDLRNNIPGEPGIDYAAYLTIPKTTFSCIGRDQGYYADEETGCQVFHVCDDDLISSFLCPVGSLFSQHLLTCDWWSKVACSQSHEFYNLNHENDVRKIPYQEKYPKPEGYLAISNSFKHDREQHTVAAVDLHTARGKKNDHRRKSENKLREFHGTIKIQPQIIKLKVNDIVHNNEGAIPSKTSANKYQDSPIVRINAAKLPKSITPFKIRQNSDLNEDTPSAANSMSTVDEQLDTNKNNHDSLVVDEGSHKTSAAEVVDLKREKTPIEFAAPAAHDMEGKESVGLVNAHTERRAGGEGGSSDIKDGIQFDGDSATDIIIQGQDELLLTTTNDNASLETTKDTATMTKVTETSTDATVTISLFRFKSPKDEIKKHEAEDVAPRPDVTANHTTMNIAVNVAPKRDDGYKAQNIHNITGFKINRPAVAKSENVDAMTPTLSKLNSEKVDSKGRLNKLQHQGQTSRTSDHKRIIIQKILKHELPMEQTSLPSLSFPNEQAIVQQEKFEGDSKNYNAEENESTTMVNIGTRQQSNLFDHSQQKNDFANSHQREAQQSMTLSFNPYDDTLESIAPQLQRIYKDSYVNGNDEENVEFEKYRVNYQTHHYPDIFSKQAIDYYDYQHYDDGVVEDDGNVYLKNFGSRISNQNNNKQKFLKLNKNTEISSDAHKINLGLQGDKPAVDFLWAMSQAIANNEQLPRPFIINRENMHHLIDYDGPPSTTLNILNRDLSNDGLYEADHTRQHTGLVEQQQPQQDENKHTVQTEFIPSLGYDFGNDQEKQKYYENFQEYASPPNDAKEGSVPIASDLLTTQNVDFS